MRRVFDRKASFSLDNQLQSEIAATLAEAESASKAAPDSRDRTVALYKALMSSGKVGEALELTAHDVVICTSPPSPRALPAAEVAAAVERAGLEVEVVPDVAEAVVWVANRPPHVQVTAAVVLAGAQASATVVHRS